MTPNQRNAKPKAMVPLAYSATETSRPNILCCAGVVEPRPTNINMNQKKTITATLPRNRVAKAQSLYVTAFVPPPCRSDSPDGKSSASSSSFSIILAVSSRSSTLLLGSCPGMRLSDSLFCTTQGGALGSTATVVQSWNRHIQGTRVSLRQKNKRRPHHLETVGDHGEGNSDSCVTLTSVNEGGAIGDNAELVIPGPPPNPVNSCCESAGIDTLYFSS